jgi:hypothetical protein
MDAAGAKAHDVIVGVNGSADASPAAVRAVVRAAKPGDAFTLSLVRAGERRDVTVKLAAWDPKHMVNPLGRQDPVPPAMASSSAPAPATAPAGGAAPAAGTAPAAGSAPATQGDDLAAARARIAELERQMQAEDAVRKAIRPQPAPQPK